jgi:hypothetical protein
MPRAAHARDPQLGDVEELGGGWGLENLPSRWHEAIRAAGRSYDGAARPEDNEVSRVARAPFVEMVRQRLPAKQHRSGLPPWS